jgi:membrane associated rhomboid family serine protease
MSKVLAAVLVAVFVLQTQVGGYGVFGLTRWGALYPGLLGDGAWWTFASYGLVHMGWAHVAMNAAAIVLIGRHVEAVIGPARAFLVFSAGVVGGGALSVAVSPDVLSGGASGGAWGLAIAELALVHAPGLRAGKPSPTTSEAAWRDFVVNALISLVPGVNGLAHLGGGLGGGLALAVTHGRAWGPVAGLAAASHAAALAVAVWVGRPWELVAPLGSDVEVEVADGFARAMLPSTLALDANGGMAGDARRDPFHVVFFVDKKAPGAWIESWREPWGITGVRELECGEGCAAKKMSGPNGVLVGWTQSYGPATLGAMVVITPDAPRDRVAWAVGHVGTLEWTDKGAPLLAWAAAEAQRYGALREARRAADLASALAVTDAATLNALAWTYVTLPPEHRDGERGLALAQRAVAASPEDGAILDTLAVAYEVTGDLPAALAAAERAAAASPEHAEIRARRDAYRARVLEGEPADGAHSPQGG